MKTTTQFMTSASAGDSALLDDLRTVGRVVRSEESLRSSGEPLDRQIGLRQAAWLTAKVLTGQANDWDLASHYMALQLLVLSAKHPALSSDSEALGEIRSWLTGLKCRADEPLNNQEDMAELFADEVIGSVTFFGGLGHLTDAA
ncbi:MAG TPA: hypothetical protein VHZ98_09475 [Galbitalea sp.]|jgi:hypothetical protein|nr:hypothetical protein [Galbitalea sp.]